MDKYEQQANSFLEIVGAKIESVFVENGLHFLDDKEKRDIYSVTISKNGRSYTLRYGQSLARSGKFYFDFRGTKKWINEKTAKQYGIQHYPRSKEKTYPPTNYDILACVTKCDPGLFADFCGDFGYDEDSIKAKTTYADVRDEYLNLSRLFSDVELEQMAEIQ